MECLGYVVEGFPSDEGHGRHGGGRFTTTAACPKETKGANPHDARVRKELIKELNYRSQSLQRGDSPKRGTCYLV